jgi:hypothetical protein
LSSHLLSKNIKIIIYKTMILPVVLYGRETYYYSGLLYKPQMIGEDDCGAIGGIKMAGETEVLGENLPQRHFVHHKSHMTRPGLEPRTAAVGSQRLTA